jgi:pimeloyl-ACP methyl ester carboxylesterase
MGDGSPTVVLEAGFWRPAGYWLKIQQELASVTTVCAYDRAGLGESDPSPSEKRMMPEIVEDLELLLAGLPAPGPYVMAGHSLAGPILRVYQDQHQDQVLGMILLDASPGIEWDEQLVSNLPSPASDDPDWVHQFFADKFGGPLACEAVQEWLDDQQGALERWDFCSIEAEDSQTGDFGSKPLVVLVRDTELEITGCISSWEFRAGDDKERLSELCRVLSDGWLVAQQGLAELSTNSRLEVVVNANHVSLTEFHSQPFVDAVLEVFDQVK